MYKIAEKKLWLLESFNAAQMLLELAGEKLIACPIFFLLNFHFPT